MKTFKIKHTVLFTICLLILSTSGLFSQLACLPAADGVRPRDEPPGCRICSWDIYNGSTGGMSPESSPVNAPCSIENSQWIHFTSDDRTIFEAKLQAYSCNSNKGIEAVLFDKNMNPVSDCFTDSPSFSFSLMRVEQIKPFEDYYLMIDGIDGDICSFLFEPVRGMYLPETYRRMMLCPGDCFQLADSCFSESTSGNIFGDCSGVGSLTIIHPDTGKFELNFFIDSFINSYAINWDTIFGVHYFDIYADDVFLATQNHTSFILPIANPNDSIIFKVIPKNENLDCDFYQSEIICHTSESTSSTIEKTEKLEIIIFPNPNQGIFKIETDFKVEKIEVFDIHAKQISAAINSFSNQTEVDMTEKESGVYFLKLYSKESVFVKKIILN